MKPKSVCPDLNAFRVGLLNKTRKEGEPKIFILARPPREFAFGIGVFDSIEKSRLRVLHFVYDSLESLRIVEGEVSEHLTVDFDTCLMDEAHELAVREILKTSGSVDTLDPKSAEIALFLLAVAIRIGKTLFPSIFGNGPYITTASIVTAGQFQDFLSFCSRGNVVD